MTRAHNFKVTRIVEARSLKILQQFMMMMSNGTWALNHDQKLSVAMMRAIGDATMFADGKVLTIEHKAEERTTGNLYIEVWSNKAWGSIGWCGTSKADLLVYHFLDTNDIYVVRMATLKAWVQAEKARKGGKRYPIKGQSKYPGDDPRGMCVPFGVLMRECGMLKFNAVQLSLLSDKITDAPLARSQDTPPPA